jgi:transcriptional regulator CtsR
LVEVLGLAEVTAVLDLVEMVEVPGLIEVAMGRGLTEMIDQEKCIRQLVVTVETNVKYHSSQKITDQFIAESVFKIINHKNVEVLDLTEAADGRGLAETIEVQGLTVVALGLIEALGLTETTDQEKCIRQLVVTVETNVKYHSSQKITDQFIAENVFKITDKIKNLS